jgi:hypothetical protein
MIVLLDSNTLGIIAKPEKSFDELSDESQACQQWFYGLLSRGNRVLTSEISDYEVRRGLLSDLISSNKTPPGLQVLDSLAKDGLLEFLPVSKKVLILAANLWAEAASIGKQTSDSKNIDADMIISAQYQILCDDYPGQRVIVATTNLKHLSIFCEAANWRDIKL